MIAHESIFAHRFARCIDWLQWGNESFGGARGYKFRGNEFNSGCDWQNQPPKEFGNLSQSCKQEAIELILDWQHAQMWAALEGSALAGRPLRMTSTGISHNNVRNGWESGGNPSHPNYPGFYITSRIADWCNENQVYFSMHTHYITVQNATLAIQRLVDDTYWTPPNWRISTELGAQANFNHSWWARNDFDVEDTNKQYFSRYFFNTYGNPSHTYETFVTAWMNDLLGQWSGDGPQLDVIFAAFDAAGFTGLCWSAMQWNKGPDADNLSVYLIEALRGNQVRSGDMFEQGNQTERYTPIKTAFETDGAQYKIGDFEPHEDGCEECAVCPGCCD